MSEPVHPTAIVHPEAELAPGVRVGPYAVIGAGVRIDADTEVGPHAVIEGPTSIGRGNRIFPFASLGQAPQDLKYRGERTTLVVGDENLIREFVTLNRGTVGGGGETRIGDRNLLMAYVHVAHDCRVGDDTVFANAATIAGHVVIEDRVILGGMAAVGQFVRLGNGAFVAAGSMVSQDVPPFCLARGDRARLYGLNLVGLRRRGMAPATIRALEKAYRTVFRSGLTLDEACAQALHDAPDAAEVAQLVQFLRSCERGLTR